MRCCLFKSINISEFSHDYVNLYVLALVRASPLMYHLIYNFSVIRFKFTKLLFLIKFFTKLLNFKLLFFSEIKLLKMSSHIGRKLC